MQLAAPENFDFTNTEQWPSWIRRFERYRAASGLKDKLEETQISALIYTMGDFADDIFESFKLTADEKKVYATVREKFDQHFTKKKNVIYERAKFNSRKQEKGEPVDTFITSLYKLASKCEYGTLHDDMIRDRIVVGIENHSLSEKLQLDETLTLEKVVKNVRESEAVRGQQPEMRELKGQRDVEAIDKGPDLKGHKTSPQSRRGRQSSPKRHQRPVHHLPRPQRLTQKESVCTRCGKKHPSGRQHCIAKCHKCGKTGHFQRMCRSVTVNDLAISEAEDTYQFLGAITETEQTGPWMITLTVNQRNVKFKIDTGADVTVVSEKVYRRERDGPLKQAKTTLIGPGQQRLRVAGCFEANLETKDQKVKDTVYVVRGLQTPLIGRPSISKLNLVTRMIGSVQDKTKFIESEYPVLFNRLGVMKESYRIELEEGAKPYSVNVPRRVPIPLLPKVKRELERMEKLGVISKINEPTDWCAGMVVVPKPDGNVRICVDLTRLNKFVKRKRHILPAVDQVLAQVGDSKVFSKLDANSGFWQIPLAPESSKLTTFITPFGRYVFNRLPFGISSAPEFFQRRISEILQDCPGVVGLIDDVLVHGKTEDEHHSRLITVLEKLKQEGVTLNKEKCIFYSNSIHFLGHKVDENGVSPDEDKVKAIQNMKAPTNVTEVRRFLGMLNQLSKFSPNLATKSKPIRDLLSKKNKWYWGIQQERAFTELKNDLKSASTLALFEPERESRVSADASSYGLGAVLRQKQPDGNWKAIAYISRSMTTTEQRYAQIEKEALALTWACERLAQYLIGSKFTLETDHKPLVPILSTKNLEDLPIRVQRFRLRMMRFQYEIVHVPGKELNTADWSPLPETGLDDLQNEIEAYVDQIVNNLPATDKHRKPGQGSGPLFMETPGLGGGKKEEEQ